MICCFVVVDCHTSAIDCLEILVSEMTYHVSSGRGGATVLKVGGSKFCERTSRNFLDPHFLASGDKILLR